MTLKSFVILPCDLKLFKFRIFMVFDWWAFFEGFPFSRGSVCFLKATPERLLLIHPAVRFNELGAMSSSTSHWIR